MEAHEVGYDEDAAMALAGQIGARIREARKSKGFSQSELADRIGMTQSSVCQIERGRRAQVKTDALVRIARALNTSAEYLIVGETAHSRLGEVIPPLRDVLKEVADMPECQQEEMADAIRWLIDWRRKVQASMEGR